MGDERTVEVAVPGVGDLTGDLIVPGEARADEVDPHLPGQVGAVVSRGGRPDLADTALGDVSPTLLIVGGRDDVVLDLTTGVLTSRSRHAESRVAYRSR